MFICTIPELNNRNMGFVCTEHARDWISELTGVSRDAVCNSNQSYSVGSIELTYTTELKKCEWCA